MPSSAILVVCLGLLSLADAVRVPVDRSAIFPDVQKDLERHKKKHHPFTSPEGLFIQERESKALPGPGQHYFFGAIGGEAAWDKIHDIVNSNPNTKLVLMVRHGQAISNWLGDTLGPDEWFEQEKTCSYTDDNRTTYGIFDAGWFDKFTKGQPTRIIVSPLSRCLRTAEIVTQNLSIPLINVEENIRETLGEDTCDGCFDFDPELGLLVSVPACCMAVSDPDPEQPERLEGPCSFKHGLKSKWPTYPFPIVDESTRASLRGKVTTTMEQDTSDLDGTSDDDFTSDGDEGTDSDEERSVRQFRRKLMASNGAGFGLVSDRDLMWTDERERQKHQVGRAENFLHDLFAYANEKVVFVVTHSGFTRSLLLAVGREPYRPQNTELVPRGQTRTAS
eukprot:gene9808-7696_t